MQIIESSCLYYPQHVLSTSFLYVKQYLIHAIGVFYVMHMCNTFVF